MKAPVSIVMPPPETATAVTRSPQLAAQISLREFLREIVHVAPGRQFGEAESRVGINPWNADIRDRVAQLSAHAPLVFGRCRLQLACRHHVARLAGLQCCKITYR